MTIMRRLCGGKYSRSVLQVCASFSEAVLTYTVKAKASLPSQCHISGACYRCASQLKVCMNQFSAHQNGVMHQNATDKSTIMVRTRIQLSATKILNHVNQ